MNRRNILKFSGILAVVFALTANLQYAIYNYGIGKNNLGLAIVAQTSSSSGGNSNTDVTGTTDDPNDPWIYSMPADVEVGGNTDQPSGGGSTLQNYEMKTPLCITSSLSIKFPIKQSQLNIALSSKKKCKTHSGYECNTANETSCGK
ncbi:hypothetical protein SAMN05428949_0111 [Chitinophaga sp. YR627]|uniref:hypothetical protein n=1 Tax=Chitinophaga sp. YR627 TaxID=1881041 RepID=UPI0008ED8FD3|nr:hypothetical protein [Chitinophaga sp. YR627]SFM59559.1 hypothetical protein SAMN05428949_0111 [Chitinophaga sp. YR627]